jgi:hypothetical protein
VVVGAEIAAQAGDVHIEAAAVEKSIIAPQCLEYLGAPEHLVALPVEVLQHLGFAVREGLRMALVMQALVGIVELVLANCHHGGGVGADTTGKSRALMRTTNSSMLKGFFT